MKRILVLSLVLLFGVAMMGMAEKSLFVDGNLYVEGTSTFVDTATFGAVEIVGNFSIDGTTVSLDGSTSVDLIGGHVDIESADIRIGYDGDDYMKLVTTVDTGALAITHVGGSAPDVTWTADSWTLTGGFEIVGSTTLDDTTISTTLGIGTDLTMSGLTGVHDWFLTDSVVDALSIQRGTTDFIVLDTSTVSVDITGDIDQDGVYAILDGSTYVKFASAGYVNTESDDIRLGLDADDYMKLVTSADTANLAITHPGNTGALITWTAGGWTLTGAFEIVGTTTLDDFVTSSTFTMTQGEILNNAADGVVTLTGDDATGIQLQVISADHDTTGDASLVLDADAGGDNADTWIITSQADGNDLSVINHETEVLNLTTSGDLQIDGDATVDGGEVTVSNAATDIVVKSDTDAALEVYDGTTKLIGIDTRNTVSGVEVIELNPGAGSIPDGAASTRNGVVVKAATTTMAGTTQITTPFDGLSFQVEVPTITRTGAATVDKASTVYIAGIPVGGGDVTITAPYSLEVEAGTSLFGGDIKFDGALDFVVDANTDAAFELYDGTTAFIAVDSRNTVSAVEVIELNPGAATIPDGATSTRTGVAIKAATTTLAGTTQVTTAFDGLALQIEAPVLTRSGAVTVDKASTFYIAAEPTGGGDVTIAAPYAFEIGSGNALMAGTLEAVSTVKGSAFIVDDGGDDLTVDSDDQTNASAAATVPNFADETADFLMTNLFTTILPFMGGMVGEDTDGTATNGGGMVGSTVDITTHDFNNGGGGAGDVFCKVYDNGATTWDDVSTTSGFTDWTADYQLQADALAEETGDAFAIGFAEKFAYVVFDDFATGTGQAATYATTAGKWQYSKGTGSWGDLTVFDNTDTGGAQDGAEPLCQVGAITFAPPSDWAVATYDGAADKYWIQWLCTAAQITQPAIIGVTGYDEPIVGIPTTDSWQAPYKLEIVDVRVTDMGATVHDQIIKFVVANFTDSTFSEELSWAASQFNDKFTLASVIACDANDIVGIVVTDDATSTNNPTWAVEFEVTYED